MQQDVNLQIQQINRQLESQEEQKEGARVEPCRLEITPAKKAGEKISTVSSVAKSIKERHARKLAMRADAEMM